MDGLASQVAGGLCDPDRHSGHVPGDVTTFFRMLEIQGVRARSGRSPADGLG